MKKFLYLAMAIMLFAACSSDDDESTKVVYAFDADGMPVLANPDLQNISLQNFQQKICGGAWVPLEDHLIQENGTVSKDVYDDSNLDGKGYEWYYIEKDSLVRYAATDYPPFFFYDKEAFSYDEKTGNVVGEKGNKIFTIATISNDGTFSAIEWGYGLVHKGDKIYYCQCTYKHISESDYLEMRKMYKPRNTPESN